MKQTAVEWLVEQIDIKNPNWLKEEIEKAKEMEKQQIVDAHGNKTKNSRGISNYTYILTGEEYYKKTFKNDENTTI